MMEMPCLHRLIFCAQPNGPGTFSIVSSLSLSPYLFRSQHRLCFHLNFASLSSYARTRSSSSMRPQHAAKKKQSVFRPILLTRLLSHYAADAERENCATALSRSLSCVFTFALDRMRARSSRNCKSQCGAEIPLAKTKIFIDFPATTREHSRDMLKGRRANFANFPFDGHIASVFLF